MFSCPRFHVAAAPYPAALRFMAPFAADADATGRLASRRRIAPTTISPAGRAMSFSGLRSRPARTRHAQKVQGGQSWTLKMREH